MSHKGPVFHPTATGNAAHTADAHNKFQDITLWAGWVCLLVMLSEHLDLLLYQSAVLSLHPGTGSLSTISKFYLSNNRQ